MTPANRPLSDTKSADQRCAAIAAGQYGVISRTQALNAGLSSSAISRRLGSGHWERVYESVYRYALSPRSWRQQLLAACHWCGPPVAVSHRAAASLWEFQGGPRNMIEISTPKNAKASSPELIVHRVAELTRRDIEVVQAIPITSPSRTVIDLAAVLDRDALEVALDSALHLGRTTIPRLKGLLAHLRSPGRPGVRCLERLLNERAPGAAAASALETKLRRIIWASRLPPPQQQYVIRHGGRFLRRADFAYPQARIDIEADSYRWHADPAGWQRDRRIDKQLNRLGWAVLRFTDDELSTPRQVVAEIEDVLYPRMLQSNDG